MPKRDIVVIGGSAFSLTPLQQILSGLPAKLPASILVATHTAEDNPGLLDRVLSRAGPLPASYPVDQEPIRPGHVYLARADHHLSIEDGRMRVQRGPRENRHRPAIDPLFRTAAREHGASVIGVILSGQDDDGSAGLFAVKQRNGIAIVQDPEDAVARVMPESALEYARPQYILRSCEIASTLVRLVNAVEDETEMPKKKEHKKPVRKRADAADETPSENLHTAYSNEGEGRPSVFACPECHGVLWELKNGGFIHFRCRVGHSYGIQSLARELSQSSESALWAAMRALEEKAAMQRRLADTLGENNRSSKRLLDQSTADDANARLIRDMIFRRDGELESAPTKSDEAA